MKLNKLICIKCLKLYLILFKIIHSYFTLSHKQKFMHFAYTLIKYPNLQNGMVGEY